jgi:2-methylcitrate dehydratase PrpD
VNDTISAPVATLSEHLAAAGDHDPPAEVRRKAIHHVLDTVAAMLSGARLEPGRAGIDYVRSRPHAAEATVLGTDVVTTAADAALANGMTAHADETDDSHAPSLSHPGCAIVPAAWAVAERQGRSGAELLRAVIAGYDTGTRVALAIGRSQLLLSTSTHSSHAIVGVFGAAAAAAVLEGFDARQVRYVLSYAAQQAAGVTAWMRDERHVQKAYVFGGMPARNGIEAATLVASGMDGVEDPFTGFPNFLDAYSSDPDVDQLADGLGERFEVQRTNIKKYAVGSPAQAAIDAILALHAEGLRAGAVADLEVRLPADLANVVDGRTMPAINAQYLVAGTLVDGAFSFEMAHDEDRLRHGTTADLVERVQLIADPATTGTRAATVTATTHDGDQLTHHVPAVRGTADDPMTDDEVVAKARDLLETPLGEDTDALIETIWKLESVDDVRELAPLTNP